MKKAAFHNLGCKVNYYETEAMLQSLEENGYQIVDFEDKADIYIVNTCSVTNMADRKSRQMLHKAKKNNPEAVVVAVGCYVQAVGEQILKDNGVDIAIGNDQKGELSEILRKYYDENGEAFVVEDLKHPRCYENISIVREDNHTRAYIKVQDGCNQFCSYCIIPYVRGRIRSRMVGDVITEITSLVAQGVSEVVLTGIHLSSYGLEKLRASGDYGGQTFATNYLLELIERVSAIPGLKRVRLGSLEPRIITEDFALRLAQIPQICPHFHLSLQSGCDSVLKRMNRMYTAAEYREKCEILRRCFDNPAITTDVIVGFPGETEDDFETTREYLKEIKLYETHIFKYSPRRGTQAAIMKQQVPESVKNERSATLIELGAGNAHDFRESYIGRRVEVLWEEVESVEGRDYLTGYTREYIRAAVPADAGREPGSVTEVTVEGFLTDEIMICK
ncbi:MAG: tRNA (N(6)-L-threonylcarbamoyladenosine(37)-C(2))-methylthiotransferase MtaB [Lachnospiraceae bacterium]|nr:tRNA (N(6)-L-threonylcarbamoyladenosine(37)-C(2))-methylthiotransferase MtaB [Lachnospiraceae bacterium]